MTRDLSRTTILTLMLTLAFFAFSLSAGGRVRLVPQEYSTIQRALDNSDSGDTVFVAEGRYRGAITMREDVALIGAGAERTILTGKRNKPVIRGAQGATLRHFTIQGGQMGVLCENTVMLIEDCIVQGNTGTGIHIVIALPVIRNNVVMRNGWSGIFCETTRSHRGYIAHNIIAENNYSGVLLSGSSEVLLENNVFYFNKQYGVFAADGARRSRIVNNNFFGNRQAGSVHANIDHSNLHADPEYPNLGTRDGHAFWDTIPAALRGRGREGRDIGLVRRVMFVPEKSKD